MYENKVTRLIINNCITIRNDKNEICISNVELMKLYNERKKFIENKKSKVKILDKINIGLYLVECKNCEKEFVKKQYNYNQLPKICDECCNIFNKCILCNSEINLGCFFCLECLDTFRWKLETLLNTMLEGHIKQGIKIKGLNNPSKKDDVKDKISLGLIKYHNSNIRLLYENVFINTGYSFKYKNSIGETFRSTYEVKVSEYLISKKIKYKTEVPILMKNNRYKIVDFVINNNIFIEVTGYANKSWKEQFNMKINELRKSCNNIIIIISTKDKFNELFKNISNENVFIEELYNLDKLDKTISLANNIIRSNEILCPENEVIINV